MNYDRDPWTGEQLRFFRDTTLNDPLEGPWPGRTVFFGVWDALGVMMGALLIYWLLS